LASDETNTMVLRYKGKFKYLGVAFTSGGRWRLMHGLVKQTQFCLSFIALWSQNGNFQTL